MPLTISNKQARWAWIHSQGLGTAPTANKDPLEVVRALGFVQLDSIQVVARAHHHIIWSRALSYRETMLDRMLAEDRSVFEHFTHDASIIPMDFLPTWRHQFKRKEKELTAYNNWYSSMLDAKGRRSLIEKIRQKGPLSTKDFEATQPASGEIWSRPPHKLALDFLWLKGDLAISHRKGFTKYYDLSERIFPPHNLDTTPESSTQVETLCNEAIKRLWVATPKEIQKFWEACSSQELTQWLEKSNLAEVLVTSDDGQLHRSLALSNIESTLENLKRPSNRLRILNPFDPLIRDRKRLERLFGYEYRVEMFVPAKKRKWGYYVYPILECDRFTGRIEIKADRKFKQLNVINLWAEKETEWTPSRLKKLDSELKRLARFIGMKTIHWNTPARKETSPV